MSQDARRRLDAWLFFARFFKSRGLAAKLVSSGKLRIDGRVVTKAHFTVRAGQTLSFPQGNAIRLVRVVEVGERRGPAPEAQGLYEDLSPPGAVGQGAA